MSTIEINDAEIAAKLARLRDHLGDLTQPFETIGDLLEDTTEKRFDAGVSPEGVPWAPKSQTTIDAYERRGLTVSFKPLFGPNLDTLPLRKSFFHDAGPSSLEIGTNKVQAAVMHFGAAKGQFGQNARGGSIPWGDIPARPFLGVSDTDQTAIIETIEEWLEEAVED